MDASSAKKRLDAYPKLGGEVVHRSQAIVKGPPPPDAITKEGLQKAIGFFRSW